MFIARITGSLVSSQKVESMVGQKLLIVEPLRVDEQDQKSLKGTGRSFVVVDTVGAGEGEIVLCVQGSSARYTPETKTLPVDAAIIGIVDQVQVGSNMLLNQSAPAATATRRRGGGQG
ncbi:MAG: EutN/CcmL family microcompartment protein [Planctomycetaceae bacterium]|nr:EutN/CcmL family microcompartment protein [Planctomycetaceae bacterium]